jgi:hypothetical protein
VCDLLVVIVYCIGCQTYVYTLYEYCILVFATRRVPRVGAWEWELGTNNSETVPGDQRSSRGSSRGEVASGRESGRADSLRSKDCSILDEVNSYSTRLHCMRGGCIRGGPPPGDLTVESFSHSSQRTSTPFLTKVLMATRIDLRVAIKERERDAINTDTQTGSLFAFQINANIPISTPRHRDASSSKPSHSHFLLCTSLPPTRLGRPDSCSETDWYCASPT